MNDSTLLKKTMRRASHDSAWKDILDRYLPEALAWCFPALYQQIDWGREWVGLDKELQAITQERETGTRYVDKLLKVYLKDGGSSWVLLHVELEQNPRPSFPERMFIYAARLYDKYRHPIVSCAVLTDSDPRIRPSFYNAGAQDTTFCLNFQLCKLIDFEAERAKLEQSSSPFAVVILFHLDALIAKRQDSAGRFQLKTALLRRLYEKEFSRTDVINLFRFLDFSIALAGVFELRYKEEIHHIEAEKNVTYLTSIERLGIQQGMLLGREEGIQLGRQEGEYHLLLRQLKRKFSHVPKEYEQKLVQADSETLLLWGERIFDANVLEAVFKDQ